MKLLLSLLAVAGLSGCVAYAGDPYYTGSQVYSTTPYYSGGPVYYGHAPYAVQPAPVYIHGGGWERRWPGHRDLDRDGIPNRVDRDRDGDGVPNRRDAYPNNPRRQ